MKMFSILILLGSWVGSPSVKANETEPAVLNCQAAMLFAAEDGILGEAKDTLEHLEAKMAFSEYVSTLNNSKIENQKSTYGRLFFDFCSKLNEKAKSLKIKL